MFVGHADMELSMELYYSVHACTQAHALSSEERGHAFESGTLQGALIVTMCGAGLRLSKLASLVDW